MSKNQECRCVNSNNRLNGILPPFDTSHKELSSGFHLVDNHFSFHTVNRQDKEIKSAHIRKLDRIFEDSCLDSNWSSQTLASKTMLLPRYCMSTSVAIL